MPSEEIEYRVATAADMPAITHVRTSVNQNHLSVAQLAERGITEAGVAASFLAGSKGRVAVLGGEIVAFTIANRSNRSIFALFVLPGFDGRGIGGRLLALSVGWLWENGDTPIWLETRQGTRAETFYTRKGWTSRGVDEKGNVRFELESASPR